MAILPAEPEFEQAYNGTGALSTEHTPPHTVRNGAIPREFARRRRNTHEKS